MLVISRQFGEGFWIGDNIHIAVLSGRGGDQVRVAIAAPAAVRILRDEIAGLPLPIPGGHRADDGSGASND